MSDQAYASQNDPYWLSARGVNKVQFNKLATPPQSNLNQGILYELNDSLLYYNGSPIITQVDNPVAPGTVGRLAAYSDAQEVDDTDIDYTANEGLTRVDGLKYVRQRGTSTHIGTRYNGPSGGRAIVIGETALNTYTAVCDESIAIGPQAGTNLNTLYHSVLVGTNAGLGLGAVTTRAINDSVAIGWRTLVSAESIINSITIGHNVYESLTNGISNINIGNPGTGITNESNTTRIGSSQSRCFIAGIRGVSPDIANGLPVVCSSTGQLTTQPYPESPISPGTTGRMAFYNSSNTIGNTDIAYTASQGLVRSSDNLAYIYNNLANTSLQVWNTLNPTATYFDSITMGKNILALAAAPICNTSVLIGGNVCQNVLNSSGTVAIGHRVVDTGAATSLLNNVLIGNLCCNNVTNLTTTTCIGRATYLNLLTGFNNVNIGDSAAGVTAENDTIRIGGSSLPQTRCFISGIRGITPALTDGQVVEITSDRQLTSSSSYVKGPINSIDNRIATYSGVTGKLLSNLSAITADGAANMSGVNVLTAKVLDMVGGGAIYLANTVSSIVGTIRNQSGWLFHTGVGGFDTYLGYNSGNFTGTGLNNTVVGATSLQNFTSGANNIVVGTSSGGGLTTHTDNIIIGNNVTGLVGSNNIIIGNITGVAEINTLRIGTNTQTRVFIPSINGQSPTGTENIVYIDSNGLLSRKTSPLCSPLGEIFSLGDGTSVSGTLAVQNQWYLVSATPWTGLTFTRVDNNSDFLAPKFSNTGGRLQWLGLTGTQFSVTYGFSAFTPSAGETFQLSLMIDGVVVPGSIVDFDPAVNNVSSVYSFSKVVSLSNGSFLDIALRCTSQATRVITLFATNIVARASCGSL